MSAVGQPATGSHCRCGVCGYGTVIEACGAAILVHAASCPSEDADCDRALSMLIACDNPGCRKVLDPERVHKHGAKTCNDRCRAAAWKTRHSYGRHDPEAPQGRTNGSQRPSKQSGLQVSHKRAIEAVARTLWLRREVVDMAAGRREAERILRPALSARQRAQLDARERSSP